MDDEISQEGASDVGKPAVPEEKSLQVAELSDREISSKSSLHSFLPHYSDSHVSLLNHPHVVASIANAQNCLLLFFVPLHACSQQLLLTWRAPAANYSRQLHRYLEEIFLYGFIFKHVAKGLSIDDEDMIQVLLDSSPILPPRVTIAGLLYLDIFLCAALQTAGSADALGCLHFVASYHPYLYSASSQVLYCRLQAILELVLDASNAEEVHAVF